MKIGLLLIATGKYDQFLQPLIDSVDEYFFKDHEVDIYFFSDKTIDLKHSNRLAVINFTIEHKPFPYSTLYRYKYFNAHKHDIKAEYVFYCDVDMLFVDHVGPEILPERDCNLVFVQHPGFAKTGGWGSPNVFKESTAYVPIEKRGVYVAGGFQGGETYNYLEMCRILDENITTDENNGIIAEWHDESHANYYVAYSEYPTKILSHEYCMSDADISGSPKILALTKDHATLRS